MTEENLVQFLNKTFSVPAIKSFSWIGNGYIQAGKKREYYEQFLNNHFSTKAKPFIKWVGGKRQLLPQFRNLYPTKFNPNTNTYHEPFLGGGAVFFDLQPKNAIISDLNKELVLAYKILKKFPRKLINSLEKHIYDKKYFLQIREKNPDNLSDLEIASRFIYLNKTGFNGLYRVNKKGKFNVPFGKYKNPKICDASNLENVSKVLQLAEIKHQNYKKVLENAKKGDFIYFDPPYYPLNKTSNFTSYISNAFLEKEQEALKNTFFQLHKKGCLVMLSNSDTPFIQKIYSALNEKKIFIHTVKAGRAVNSNAAKRGKITEVVITNY